MPEANTSKNSFPYKKRSQADPRQTDPLFLCLSSLGHPLQREKNENPAWAILQSSGKTEKENSSKIYKGESIMFSISILAITAVVALCAGLGMTASEAVADKDVCFQ